MVYFTAVIDLYSGKILSWRLSRTMDVGFCLDCGLSISMKKNSSIFNNELNLQGGFDYITKLIEFFYSNKNCTSRIFYTYMIEVGCKGM